MKRACFVAALWKNTTYAQIEIPSITNHGWVADGSIDWIENPFPDDITELLLNEDESDDEVNHVESDIESEDESDSDLFN